MNKKVLIIILLFFISANAFASDFVPPPRTLTRVEDEGDILTDSEEEELRTKLDEISERHQVDVVIVTNYSLGDKTPMEFADDYFDYNGYGLGEDYDGVLLLLSMEERDWWISTHGFGITAFTDYGIEYIGGKILPDLGDGDYYEGFDKFADLADDFIAKARDGRPYDVDRKAKKFFDPENMGASALISLIFGGAIGISSANSSKKTHKTIRKERGAISYLGSANFKASYDNFINKDVARSRIEKSDNSGGGGGSSTHTSSSGRSHGGGGGKF